MSVDTIRQSAEAMEGGSLAVLDYGVGGLDFWRSLRRRHPKLSTIYCSDSGYTPYGQLSSTRLAQRLGELSQRLSDLGATALVIACNAASSALPQASLALPTIGIIAAGVASVEASGYRRVGVIGGRRTIESKIYVKALSDLGVHVTQEIAQPLSICIEAGDLNSEVLRGHVTRITRPLRDLEAVLMACTHYPAITHLLQRGLPGVALIDPIETLVTQIESQWNLRSLRQDESTRVLTTGSPELMTRAALHAFNIDLPEIQRIANSYTPSL